MDRTEKINRLSEIKDEVGVFHRLLKNLLPKIPNITNVTYTHGPTEKGADFVQAKREEIVGDNIYVGVIAKVGRIHMDFQDVLRQVDECSMKRYALGGKKKIDISEIWVMTNDSVTTIAQEKIHEKFRDKKILFIEGERVVDLIEKYLPNYWYDFSAEAGAYLNELWLSNDKIDRELNLIKSCTKKIYIEQDIFPRAQFEKKKKGKKRKIDIVQEIAAKKMILIEGGMGSGKSKLLRKLVDYFATGVHFAKHRIIPIPANYKELIDDYKIDIDKFLNKKVGAEVIKNAESGTTFLLLIDGVDEKNVGVDQELKQLNDVVEMILKKGNVKAIFTSRRMIGIQENQNLNQHMDVYELGYLTTNKIIDFLNAFCSEMNVSKKIIQDIKKSSLFKELPRSPIAAILLANLINENQKEIPSNLTELYSQCMELMLGRWDAEKGLQTLKEYEVADRILMNIAEHLIDNNLSYLSVPEAEDFFKHFLKDRNIEVDALDLFKKVMERSGVLIKDSIKDTISFKHRTFLEFFYAKQMAVIDTELDPAVASPGEFEDVRRPPSQSRLGCSSPNTGRNGAMAISIFFRAGAAIVGAFVVPLLVDKYVPEFTNFGVIAFDSGGALLGCLLYDAFSFGWR